MSTTQLATLVTKLDHSMIDLTHLSVDPKAVIMYSVYDTRVKEYGHPTLAQSAALVVASIMGHIKDHPASPMAIRPADFVLYQVGAWAPTNGEIFDTAADDLPRPIGNLAELIEHLTPDDLQTVFASIDRLYNNIMTANSEKK